MIDIEGVLQGGLHEAAARSNFEMALEIKPCDRHKALLAEITRLQSELQAQTERADRAEKRAEAAKLNAYKKVIKEYSAINNDEEKYPEQYDVICALIEWVHGQISKWRGEENKGEA
jgi:lipopolysaccharide biosynthesis protein